MRWLEKYSFHILEVDFKLNNFDTVYTVNFFILFTCFLAVRNQLGTPDQTALLLFDGFAAHRSEKVIDCVKAYNCFVLFIPANLTSEAQPNEALVNRVFKSLVMAQYEEYYTTEFLRQLRMKT